MCDHKHLKKNYPFGKKSNPTIYCKDCKSYIIKKDLILIKRWKRKK